MDESQKTVFVDEEIASEVLAVVREAHQYVVMVTPYVKLWGHAREALTLAVKKGIKVVGVVRNDRQVLESDDIAWLANNGVS